MNVLVFHANPEVLKMIAFCLESQMGVNAHQGSTFADIVDLFLNDTGVDLVVAGQNAESEKLFKYILSTNGSTPFILVGDNLKEAATYPELNIMGKLNHTEIPHNLISLIKGNFKTITQSQEDEEYCRIHTELLLRVVPLASDIYIRLSKSKFVKIFQSGSKFTKEEYEKYMVRRQINYFYIKKTECQEFLTKLNQDLSQLIQDSSVGDQELFQNVNDIQEVVGQLSGKLGFTEEVQDLVKKNMKLTMKAIGQSKKLTKIISDSQLKGKNYLSSHSVMMASVACSIAAEMKWTSDRTFEKLVLASLLHDIHFQNPDLAKLGKKSEIESVKESLSEEDYKLIMGHPIKCANLLKMMSEVPSDVDIIVLQHHEYPDGTGFPKGLLAHQISPLSALLIISHELVETMIKKRLNFTLTEFLTSHAHLFTSAAFKKIGKALGQSEADEEESEPAIKKVA